MEKTIKKLFLGGSAVAVAALALAPVAAFLGGESAYAADTATSNFSVTVSSTLSLEVTQAPSKLTVGAGGTQTGQFTARVISNKGYNIMISATEPSLKPTSGSGEIQSKADFSRENSGWAIQDKTVADDPVKYKAVTASDQPFFTSADAQTAGLNTVFQWGVAVGYDIPDGDYSTQVKLTATTAN